MIDRMTENNKNNKTNTYVLALNSTIDVVLKNFQETLQDEKIVSTTVHENKLIVITEKNSSKKVLCG